MNLKPREGMDVRKGLHDWLLQADFRHNKGDGTYSKHLSGTFSVEVSEDLSIHIVCSTDISETDITHFELSFDMLMGLFAVERALCNVRATMNNETLYNNLAAAMKMLEQKH